VVRGDLIRTVSITGDVVDEFSLVVGAFTVELTDSYGAEAQALPEAPSLPILQPAPQTQIIVQLLSSLVILFVILLVVRLLMKIFE